MRGKLFKCIMQTRQKMFCMHNTDGELVGDIKWKGLDIRQPYMFASDR